MPVLINLIGEQPIPNLLPVFHLKPEKTIILYTATTNNTAKRIEKLIENCEKKLVEPYDINQFKEVVKKIINPYDRCIFNITGGTKIMSVALFEIASEKRAPILYLQSEGKETLLYQFTFNQDGSINQNMDTLPELINADIYLRAHLWDYDSIVPQNNSGSAFEKSITDVLKSYNFEVISSVKPKGEGNQLEVDAVIRLKGTNNVGIAEIKIGDRAEEGPKKGIDQLALAGQREYLGTYTQRFLITSRILSKQIKELAQAHRINVIDEITQNKYNNDLADAAKIKLIQRIKEKLS